MSHYVVVATRGETMFRITAISLLAAALAVLSLTGCTTVDTNETEIDLGIQWVRSAAEYEALSLQAYGAATNDLQKFIADTSWSALPGQTDAAELPLAIIADVDETLVSNVEFQVILVQPFKNSVMNTWNDENKAKPIPGATEFIRLAQDAGVEVFFVTNRPCELISGIEDPCPQKAVTLQDLIEVGIDADNDHLMLADENPGWDREKLSRREHIARTHRVIMLLGDDLGDFISCSRKKVLHPCTESATLASRQAATNEFSHYWGEGWYVLPNPMHGSWSSVN
jgi:acid phosphatase